MEIGISLPTRRLGRVVLHWPRAIAPSDPPRFHRLQTSSSVNLAHLAQSFPRPINVPTPQHNSPSLALPPTKSCSSSILPFPICPVVAVSVSFFFSNSSCPSSKEGRLEFSAPSGTALFIHSFTRAGRESSPRGLVERSQLAPDCLLPCD